MALTRADIVANLAGSLSQPLETAKVPDTDTTGGLKEPVDAALRALGVTDVMLVTPDLSEVTSELVMAVATLTTLERIRSSALTQVNLEAGNGAIKLDRNQFLAGIERWIADARAEVSKQRGELGADSRYISAGQILLSGGVASRAW